MAKSKSSCFRIMTCTGRDSASADEPLLLESNTSSDKSRWSFRKRLSLPRVVSKNATLDHESADYNKDSMEATISSFNSAINVCAPVKAAIANNPSNEEFLAEPLLSSIPVNSNAAQRDMTSDEVIQESAARIIQAAIRLHLGVKRKEVKSVTKLQAAVRGLLVRIHAVGTLHCLFAIIKMQAIFRSRHASQLQETRVGIGGKKVDRSKNDLYLLGKEKLKSIDSTKKLLLSSRFVNRMLASAPKSRHIRLRCDTDPSKPDSAWKWLETWTTWWSAEQCINAGRLKIPRNLPSECGTEISISSTLDSPDRSETECGEIVLEIAKNGAQTKQQASGSDPDCERRTSGGSSSSLPSYMRATKSARAKKVRAKISPRSSPDLNDSGDSDKKRRHSLPKSNHTPARTSSAVWSIFQREDGSDDMKF